MTQMTGSLYFAFGSVVADISLIVGGIQLLCEYLNMDIGAVLEALRLAFMALDEQTRPLAASLRL